MTEFIVTENELFTSQADDFLKGLKSHNSPNQVEAVLKAASGDLGDLSIIRSRRNVKLPLSRETVCRSLRPDLKLFAPKIPVANAPVLFYLHGGGWVLGSINSCSAFCMELAKRGINVVSMDYKLAPENPFPKALEGIIEAISFLCEQAEDFGVDPNRISLGGDSSGGNLALSAALSHDASTKFKLRSLVLFYPVVRAFDDHSGSFLKYASGFGLDADLMRAFCQAYLQGAKQSYLASPDLADLKALSQLPRTLMIASQRDVLYDQGKAFCEKLKAAGVPFIHETLSGSVHLFITVKGQDAAFAAAAARTEDWLKSSGKL